MPMHKRPFRRRTEPTRRPPPKFARPVIEPFPDEEGAFAAAQGLVEKYRGIVDGHQAAIRQFLEDCLPVVRKFQCEADEFERLKADLLGGGVPAEAAGSVDLEVAPVLCHAGENEERSQSRRPPRGGPRRTDPREGQA
jgi:hypothetical protein